MCVVNPKVTWRTQTVLDYFQSEFEGICRTVLETFNKERLYKSARSTQWHQKEQIWGWTIISMKLESFRLSCNTMLRYKSTSFVYTWFTCTQRSLVKNLASQSGSKIFLKLHLLWVVLWSFGFAYFSLHKFSRNFVRNTLLFTVFDNPMYMTSSIAKFHGFCNSFKWRGELVCGAQIS